MRIIDLSVPVHPNPSEPMPITIKTQGHSGGSRFGRRVVFLGKKSFSSKLAAVWNYLNGRERLTKNCFPDSEFINEEHISLSVHTGTHLDAPYHFGTKSEGKAARTIDSVPLEWCYGDALVLNFSGKQPGAEITKSDIQEQLDAMRCTLRPFDIVLLRTDTDKKWGTPRYFFEAPGLGRDGTEFLVSSGVKVIGTDCYSLDKPFLKMIQEFYRTRDQRCLWPAHFYGREKEYCHIERLCNLDQLPRQSRFKFCCFPIKLKGLGAAWIRAVAIIDE